MYPGSRSCEHENARMILKCAQSIPRLEKPPNSRFPEKNRILVHFSFNTPTTFPKSGSGKHFRASGMRVQNFWINPIHRQRKIGFQESAWPHIMEDAARDALGNEDIISDRHLYGQYAYSIRDLLNERGPIEYGNF
jgi:hypothetical protein